MIGRIMSAVVAYFVKAMESYAEVEMAHIEATGLPFWLI